MFKDTSLYIVNIKSLALLSLWNIKIFKILCVLAAQHLVDCILIFFQGPRKYNKNLIYLWKLSEDIFKSIAKHFSEKKLHLHSFLMIVYATNISIIHKNEQVKYNKIIKQYKDEEFSWSQSINSSTRYWSNLFICQRSILIKIPFVI